MKIRLPSIRGKQRALDARAIVLLPVVFWTAAGAVLRVFQIGVQSLWLDELFSVAVARRDWTQVISSTAQGDTNPPLFNLALHLVLQFGSDETAARAASAFFSVLTIPLFYLFARRLFRSTRIANVAAALIATSPFQVAYAQEARMYALLGLCQLVAFYFFHRAWTGGKRQEWIAFVIAETFAFYSHSLAVLGLFALDVFGLWRWRELGARWKDFVAAQGLIALLFVPWLPMFVQQAGHVAQGFWNPSSTLFNLLRTVYVLNFNSALPTNLVPIGLTAAMLLFVLGLYVSIRALAHESLPPSERQSLQLALAIALVPPIALLALSIIRPIYIERVLISSALGLFLIWAWAWTQRPRWLDRAAIVAGMFLVGIALWSYYFDPQSQKPPMRAAAQALASRWQPGNVVIHTSDWTALAFQYYLPMIPQHFLAGDPVYVEDTTRGRSGRVAGLVPERLDQISVGNSPVWLVVALEHSQAYQQQRVDEFDARYVRQATLDIGQIYLFEYRTKR